MLAHGDEQLVHFGVEIVEFEGAQRAVFIFLDEDDVHKAHDAALRQIQELGHDLAREPTFFEFDQGVFQWKVEHINTP